MNKNNLTVIILAAGKGTPFGLYDADTDFQADAITTADWCAKRLGYPLVDVELQSANFFTCFEEAINEYGAQLYNFQIINNYKTLEGNETGSNTTPYNNKLITYVGYSKNLNNRIKLHNSSKGSKFTRGRSWKIIYTEK